MEQKNLFQTSGQKVFYVYGIPKDQHGSDMVSYFSSQKCITGVNVVGNKVKVVVHDKESIETMREKFSCFEGHDLFIMPELFKEVRVLIDEEWIEVKNQFCPKFKNILQEKGVDVSKTPEGVFLTGSLEGINLASQIITEAVEGEILKNHLSLTSRNGLGFPNYESGSHAASVLSTECPTPESELTTGTAVEKLVNSMVGSIDETDSVSKSDRHDLAVAAAVIQGNVKHTDGPFQELSVEPNATGSHSRNQASSMDTNGKVEMTASDQNAGHFNGSMADACTINLQDYELQFVQRFHPDLYEPLVRHHTLDMSVRRKNYGYLSDLIKKNNLNRLMRVTENPESGRGEFLVKTKFLKGLNIEREYKLLINCPPQSNTVEIIGLQENIDKFQKDVDKSRESLIRKAQHGCLSLNEKQIKFVMAFYSKAFENIEEQFLLKEPDGPMWILGTSDNNVGKLRNWIEKTKIDHLQTEEQTMPYGIDEKMCKAVLHSLSSEVKLYLEFPSTGKILIVGLEDDIKKFKSVLRIKSDEVMNAALKKSVAASSSNGAVGPVSRTDKITADEKHSELIGSASSGAIGRGMATSEIIHLQDCQWQFTQRFHFDLYSKLTDYFKQNLEVRTRHYARTLDMIQNSNIDRVVKVTESVKDVATSVLQRLSEKLPGGFKILSNFSADGNMVEIIGLPEDVERWWILLRKEIDAYRSNLSRKTPQASFDIQTHEFKFIESCYSDVFDYIKGLHVLNKSKNGISYAGTFDEIDKLKVWLRKHDIDRLVTDVGKIRTFVDEEDCKEVHDSMKATVKLCLSFPSPRIFEVIGFKGDIKTFYDELERRGEVNKKKLLAKSDSVVGSSRSQYDSSHLYGATSSSDREFAFLMPLSSIQVKVAQGDLIKQRTDAIVNPCNGHLKHYGGAAKAIADAAGRDLVEDCKKYISENKILSTSEVMHTRSGRLYPPIKHVIHASGPDVKSYPDKGKCQSVLEDTFFNCFRCANNDLQADSLSVPAISSGTFGVSKDVVAQSAWNALMRFDDQMSKPSQTKCLKFICFVNIDQESTYSLIQTFKKHWNAYLFEQKSRVEIAKSEGSKTSSSRLRRSGSLPRRSSQKDQEMDTEKARTYAAKTKQDQSEELKSVRGTTVQGIPQIKGGSAGSAGRSNAAEAKCSVCLKLKKISLLLTRNSCLHKCCALCLSGKCQQCTGNMKMESGPSSARALVQSPTGRREEKDNERRPESPEAMVNGNAKTTRSRQLRRSASVGGFRDLTKDMNGIDLKEERSEDRTSSSTASSVANSQQAQQDDVCCICMDKIEDPKKLDCGHVFCRGCIEEQFKHQPKCPSCGRIYGLLKGNQPDGKMTVMKERSIDLEGYRGCGAIVIMYDIPDGIQTADHPNPGQKFHGTERTAFLPGNAEGEEVCRLLEKAFEAKLVFTVGKSNTTGRDNVVIWNDIHHKTSPVGEYGYPDSTYLQRVKDELAAKGIKSASPTDESATRNAGGATGGYDVSTCSRWDDNRDYMSLPVSPRVHSRDYDAPLSLLTTTGRQSPSYSYSGLAGVHTASSRPQAISSVYSSVSSSSASKFPLSSGSVKYTAGYEYNKPSSKYFSPTSSASSYSPLSTSAYSLRSHSSASYKKL